MLKVMQRVVPDGGHKREIITTMGVSTVQATNQSQPPQDRDVCANEGGGDDVGEGREEEIIDGRVVKSRETH